MDTISPNDNVSPACQLLATSWINKYRPFHTFGLIFAILALLSNLLLLVIFIKFEKIRKSFRFHYMIIFIFELFMAVAVILHKSMLLFVMNNRHRSDVNAYDRLIYTLVLWGTERTSETVACFLLILVAAELYVDVRRFETRHRAKIRYISAAIAVFVAVGLEGSDYFRWEIGSGYKDQGSGCYFPFRVTMKSWSQYQKGTNPYHSVYKRWVQQIITILYPISVFVTLQIIILLRLIPSPQLRREFGRSVVLVLCIGFLFYVPELIGFLFYHVLEHAHSMIQLGLKLNFIVESANFLAVFAFLFFDYEVRDAFCELYVTDSVRARADRVVNWIRVRLFRHKEFKNEPNETSDVGNRTKDEINLESAGTEPV